MKSIISILLLMTPLLSFGEQKIFYIGHEDVYNSEGKKLSTSDTYKKVLYDPKNEVIKYSVYMVMDKNKQDQARLLKMDYSKDSKGQWWIILLADKVIKKEKVDVVFKDKKLVSISSNIRSKQQFLIKYSVKFDSQISEEMLLFNPKGKIYKQYKSDMKFVDEATFNRNVNKLKVEKTIQL